MPSYPKEIFQIGPNATWEQANRGLDAFFMRLLNRLDNLEGRTGTPTFASSLDVQGNSITNGPSTQTPDDTDFITKGYADSQYSSSVIRVALQSTGLSPLILSGLPGAFDGSGTANRVTKFITAASVGDSQMWDLLSATASSTYRNIEVGTTGVGEATDSQPFYVRRDINGSSDVVSTNHSAGNAARASFRCVNNTGADCYLSVTGDSYSAGGGVSANQAFIFTGATTVNGLAIQTAAGNIAFQPAGTTTLVTIKNANDMVTASRTNNGDDFFQIANPSAGNAARAYYNATNNSSHTINFGISSSTYTGANDTGFIGTTGAVGGFRLTTDVGTMTFYPNGSAEASLTLDNASNVAAFQRTSNGDAIVKASNPSAGAAARTLFTAFNNLGHALNVGTYGGSYTGIAADTGLIATTGLTGGLAITSDAGNISITAGGTGIGLNNATVSIHSVAYVWPGSQGAASTVLQNDGSGNLSWAAAASGVTGTGTANTVTKWTAATVIGNSLITDDGSTVSVGGVFTTTSSATIGTALNTIGALTSGTSLFVGTSAIISTTLGVGSTFTMSGAANIVFSNANQGVQFGTHGAIQIDGGDNTLELYTNRSGRTLALKLDGSDSSSQTGLWLYDGSGTLSRVTFGAADSGGTGYKLLRLPN